MFNRDRTVPVAERTFEGYEYEGIKFGQLDVKPTITAGIYATDNVYATETDRISDAAVLLAPRLSIESNGRPTSFSVTADTQINRYLSQTQENSEVYGVTGRARHDLGSGMWAGLSGNFRHDFERRSDPGAVTVSVRPIAFDAVNTRVEIGRERGRSRFIAGGGFTTIRFADGLLADGSDLSQSFRNRNVLRADLRAEYVISANMALLVRANYARNRYLRRGSADPLDRSSNRYELLGGASFEFTDLLRGEIALGYITQQYRLPVLTPLHGFGGRIQLEYLPTRLTTVTLRASRTIEEVGTAQSPSFVKTTASLTIDHELYRNVVLSAYAAYSQNAFQQPTRSDRRPAFGASGNFKLSDKVSVYGRYDYLEVSAHPANTGRNLRLHTASIGMKIGI